LMPGEFERPHVAMHDQALSTQSGSRSVARQSNSITTSVFWRTTVK
jgi:hypothetical protein